MAAPTVARAVRDFENMRTRQSRRNELEFNLLWIEICKRGNERIQHFIHRFCKGKTSSPSREFAVRSHKSSLIFQHHTV